MELYIIFFIIGVILGLFGIVASIVDEDGASLILFIFAALCVFLSIVMKDAKKEKCFEYPASSYTLEYKVTEFHGKVDTIYVLTSKKQ